MQPHLPRKHIVSWVAAALVLGLLAWQGHRFAHLLPELERVIEGLGPWAPVVYVGLVLLLTPLLVPDSLLGVAAGVVFGLGAGFVYYFAAVYCASLLTYLVGRHWLRDRVLAALEKRPSLRAMTAAAREQDLRLTLWIRLVPLNPMVVSYALGAAGVRFRAMALGTLGMFPHMFLTVYFGAAAAHVTRMAGRGHAHWTVEGIGLMLGLVACAGLVLQVSSLAWRELSVADSESQRADASD